jgi:hypothetical protein
MKLQSIRISIASMAMLALLCAGVMTFTACPKSQVDQNVAFARDVAGAVKAGCDVAIKKDSSKWKTRCETAVNDGNKLIDAFAAGDSTSVATLIRSVLPTFTDLVTEFSSNEVVLGLLAVGQIALNFFINHFLSTPVAGKTAKGARTAAAVRYGFSFSYEKLEDNSNRRRLGALNYLLSAFSNGSAIPQNGAQWRALITSAAIVGLSLVAKDFNVTGK